jgi:TonB family protein
MAKERPAPPTSAIRASQDWQIVENKFGCLLRAEVPVGQKLRAVVISPVFGRASMGALQLELAPGALPGMFNLGVKIGSAQPKAIVAWPSQDSAGMRAGLRLENADLRELEMGSIVLAAVPGETIAFTTSPAVPLLIRLGQCDRHALEAAVGGKIPDVKRLAVLSKPGYLGIFRTDDYPRVALARRQEGLVAVVLRIGADGRVKQCVVAESSGFESLDRTTCDIIRERAKYTPARDLGNQPVEGLDRARIRWALPGTASIGKKS